MDKISVITAVFNTDKNLILRVLDSLLNQSYKNFEWIITNDGSNSMIADFLDYLASKYEFIKCVHQENKGTGTAKHTAFTKATGDYITYIDSDDLAHKDYLKILLELLKENNTKMSLVSFQLVDEKFSLQNSESQKGQTEVIDFNNYIHRLSGEYQVLYGTLWGKLYSKDLFNNINFPIGYMIDDEPLIYQLAFNSKNIAVNYTDLYYYTKMENSIMNTKEFKEYRLETIEILKNRIEFLQKNTGDSLLIWVTQKKLIEELEYLYTVSDKKEYKVLIKKEYKIILNKSLKNKNASKKYIIKKIFMGLK